MFKDEVAVKRPRLPLVANPKIPTKVRQGYLDKFIDEYMNMDMLPQEAYRKVGEYYILQRVCFNPLMWKLEFQKVI